VHPEFEALSLARAAAVEQSLPELRRTVKAAAIRVDPATAQARQARAREDRCLRSTPGEDGMAELRLIHTADAIQAIFQRVDAATRLLPTSDERTRDQQRADLTIDAVLAGIPHDGLPELQGRRPSIQVLVCADTLLGLDDEPAELTGHGPITAQHARELAAASDATWQRLLTDPDTGQLLDHGRTTYRPPQDLTDFVLARDPVCFFPHCHQPGYLCDIDHTTPGTRTDTPAPATTGPAADDTTSAKPAASSATASPAMAPTPGPPTPATPTPATHPNYPPHDANHPAAPNKPNRPRRNHNTTADNAKTATTPDSNAGYKPKSNANTTPAAPDTPKQPNTPSPRPNTNATTNSKPAKTPTTSPSSARFQRDQETVRRPKRPTLPRPTGSIARAALPRSQRPSAAAACSKQGRALSIRPNEIKAFGTFLSYASETASSSG